MVNFLLKIIDLFRGLLEAIGVDYEQMRVILWAKLTIDTRKSSGVKRKRKKKTNALAVQVFIYSMLGVIFGSLIAQIDSPFVSGIFFFSFIMIMVAVALISEFTTILIDTSDNTILLPRPVSSKTMLISKIIHIAVYLMIISLSLSFVSLIVVFIKYGIFSGLVFFISIILATLFSIFITNLFYLGLMKVASGEKLKDIISYFQIVIAIVFMAAFQIIPRLTDKMDISNLSIDINWWTFFIPPAWMAGTLDAFASTDFGSYNLIFLCCAILFPVLGLWVVSKYFAPGFNRRLSQIEVGTTVKKSVAKVEKEQNFLIWLAKIFTRTPSETISFILTWKLSSRDRKFKQTVYPSFGFVFIFIAVIVMQKDFKSVGFLQGLADSQMFYIFLYFPIFIIINVTGSLRFSDDYKAAWIYEVFPVENPGNILSGGLKAALVKLFIPFYIVMGVVVLLIWRIEILPDIILAFLNILLFVSLISRMTIFSFPFSEERLIQESGKRYFKNFLYMFFAVIFGGIHFLMHYLNINVLLAIPFVFIPMILLFRSYRMLSWEKLNNKI